MNAPILFVTFFAKTVICISLICSHNANAQQCSPDALNAKYWQYRQTFNKHFILIDRGTNGCVNDGIGQAEPGSCEFLKAGYSLPATSINMAPNGGWGLDTRKVTHPPEEPVNPWEDAGCAEGDDDNPTTDPISWNNSKHNYLEMGSETPHQMGWYWVTLATEYELLKRNGQYEEAQRTLEELFLGLQAYRRLDMQAQCMVQKRYQEITDDFEVENCNGGHCLCGNKYTNGTNAKNFDSRCDTNCPFTPQLNGYSGFFLREDATQALEILHDNSEDRYNIDMVSSSFAMSSPQCTTTFSQPCFLVHEQNFMSQDGMTGLMLGLAMIKRYIPDNAEVTTCGGTKYKPLEMAKNISNAMVDNVDDRYNNRISWPKSNTCCEKEVFISEKEGGRLMATIRGFKNAADYIDDHDRKSNVDEWLAWGGFEKTVMHLNNSNEKFWLRLVSIGWDIADIPNLAVRAMFYEGIDGQNLEIVLLMNNLLYPGGNDLPTDQAFFENLLCTAPCGGPCQTRNGYNEHDFDVWPAFNCSNTPRWQGQGWETHTTDNDRLFNGLDFMALYNIYMLHYDETPSGYYNPERAPLNASFGAGRITGPDLLCLNETEYYEAQPLYCTYYDPYVNPQCVEEIQWTNSNNLFIADKTINGTDIRADAQETPSFIEAKFKEEKEIPMYYNDGLPMSQFMTNEYGNYWDPPFYDYCLFTFHKPVAIDWSDYIIETDLDHCNYLYKFSAVGLEKENTTYLWKLEVYSSGGNTTLFLNGKDVQVTWPLPGGNSGGMIVVTLTVTNNCGPFEQHTVRSYDCQGSGHNLVIAPNPATDHVYVGITDSYTISQEGLDIRFVNTGFGTVQATERIYYNGEAINIASFSEGTYSVQATLEDNTNLSTTLIISRQ